MQLSQVRLKVASFARREILKITKCDLKDTAAPQSLLSRGVKLLERRKLIADTHRLKVSCFARCETVVRRGKKFALCPPQGLLFREV